MHIRLDYNNKPKFHRAIKIKGNIIEIHSRVDANGNLSHGQRKIINGKMVDVNKPYVVYLVKAPPSPQKYDEWMCGGAIASPWFIITSAACVEDVQHMYAIAGYKKYIRAERLNEDECTKQTKKKIVFTCVPKAYELDYEKLEKWSYIDIAVVKTESAFQFGDDVYSRLCSYKPAAILVNYEPRYQDPGTDALVYGWGHNRVWRKPDDSKFYNQEVLHYAPQLLHDKSICKEAYRVHNMELLIDKYMLCSLEGGNIDAEGEVIGQRAPVLIDGCATRQQRLMGAVGVSCEENDQISDYNQDSIYDPTRRNGSQTNTETNETYTATRRHGICQNDHGGPLVRWVGAREILIGVASVFRVNNNSHCVGPFLFTSTQCNGAFLHCILSGASLRTNSICDQPASVRGFDMIERRISWIEHPEGPAENEVPVRQQVPIQIYGYEANRDRNTMSMG